MFTVLCQRVSPVIRVLSRFTSNPPPIRTQTQAEYISRRRAAGLKHAQLKPGEKLWYEEDAELMKELNPSVRSQLKATQVEQNLIDFIEREQLGRRKPSKFRKFLQKTKSQTENEPEPDDFPSKFWKGKPVFVAAAKQASSLPPPGEPEVAFAGRSNVGKSSLINHIPITKCRVVRVSDKPGLTQSINFFKMNRTSLGACLMLVDMPGYGFAYADEADIQKWSDLMKEYVTSRPSLKRTMLLVDARHGLKKSDREFMRLMDEAKLKYQVVLTKTDLVDPKELGQRAQMIKNELRKEFRQANEDVIMVSSTTGGGLSVLRRQLAGLASRKEPTLHTKDIQKSDNWRKAVADARDAVAKPKDTKRGSVKASSWIDETEEDDEYFSDEEADDFVKPKPVRKPVKADAKKDGKKTVRSKIASAKKEVRKQQQKTYRKPTAKAEAFSQSRAVAQHKRLTRRVSGAGLGDMRKKVRARNPLKKSAK